jgi:pimeloyl-ACP methyl ester carboxylesterase
MCSHRFVARVAEGVLGEDRIHRVVSDDGTEIAGRVRGQGPPLVLVPGGLGDGSPDANFMLPFLVDYFTCYCMSPRGRGVSGEHSDHSRERQYEDVATFVDGIGEPVSVFGHSAGATWVLGGAARAAASCRALALYEPALPVSRPVMTDEAYARFCSAVAEDRLTDAFWIAVDDIIVPTDEERALSALPGVAEGAAPLLPLGVRETPELNRPTDTESIEQLTMPVLLLGGARSSVHFKDALRSLTKQLDHVRDVEIVGAGHLGPMTHAEAVTDELVSFLKV